MDLAVSGADGDARAALEQTVVLSRRWGFDGQLSHGLFYLGWLYARSGAEQSAARALQEALRIAADQRYLHFILQEAVVAAPILALAARVGAGDGVLDVALPRLNGRLQTYFALLVGGETYPTDVPLGAPRRSRLQVEKSLSGDDSTDDTEAARRVRSLTAREREVLSMISAGMPNKVIAAKLFITEKTVKTHANRVYRKLDVTNRLQAVLALQEDERSSSSPHAPPRPRR
ncbi:MAG: LuxR C-terminal-related transcriptional regulator [Thermoleophilia bacterium]|nr:LuxR C-terminal-related transcriptional regulator [Thermoleophilia bacterium]